jgi:hypothetical protein
MVPSLIDWRRGEHQKRAGFAELQRSVYLEPTEVCISYVLHIDSAPGKVVLNVNGRRLGHFDGRQPFTFDITDYVALEDNTIVLRVDCSARGRFGAIYLEQMPCE